MDALFYLWLAMALGLLAHYGRRRRALESGARVVLPFSGGYLLRRRGIPVQEGGRDGFSPLYGTVFLRRGTLEGRTLRDVALAAHEAAHALRWARRERTAWWASRALALRWTLFGSGLTLAYLLNPAAIGVLALAFPVAASAVGGSLNYLWFGFGVALPIALKHLAEWNRLPGPLPTNDQKKR